MIHPDPQLIEVVKRKSGFAQWAVRHPSGRSVFAFQIHLDARWIPWLSLIDITRTNGDGYRQAYHSMWNGLEGHRDSIIDLSVFECVSASSAKELLVALIAGCQSPSYSLWRESRIGDVVLGDSEGSIIMFTCGNIAVSLGTISGSAPNFIDTATHLSVLMTSIPADHRVDLVTTMTVSSSDKEDSEAGLRRLMDIPAGQWAKVLSIGCEIEMREGNFVLVREGNQPFKIDVTTMNGIASLSRRQLIAEAAHVSSAKSSNRAQPAHEKRQPLRRLRAGRTPEKEFIIPILTALVASNGRGRATAGEVIRRIETMFKSRFLAGDLVPSRGNRRIPHWVHTVHRARYRMIKGGLLARGQDWGWWQVTVKGKRRVPQADD